MNRRSFWNLLLPGMVVFGFAAVGLLKPDTPYSEAERRVLAGKPALSEEKISSGAFMKDFEAYSLDQFPGRDYFRGLKAGAARYLFRQKDNHGYYLEDGYLSKLEYPLNTGRMEQSLKKHKDLYEYFIKDTDCRVYMSMIPDKNYYMAPVYGYPSIDYDEYVQKIRKELDFASYLDIVPELSLESYYRTDQHWSQECLTGAASVLASGMGADVDAVYEEKKLDIPFYGAYYSQAAWKTEPDQIRYLTNEMLEACTVTSYNTGKPKPSHMYDMEKAYGRDPYEMFLSGSDAFLEIENPKAEGKRELVVFRDSFASSLIPLLVPGYTKITLVDLRYMRGDLAAQWIDFRDQDILFLYSTLVF